MIETRSRRSDALASSPDPVDVPRWVAVGLHPVCQGLMLALLILLAFQPSWHAALVWDDDVLITANPQMRMPGAIIGFWLGRSMADYYPITWTIFAMEWRMFGDQATGYHVANLLFHLIGVLLIWRTLVHLRLRFAWLAAAAYAIHPMMVPTVTWVAEGKNTISMIFYAASALCWLKSEPERDGERARIGWTLVSLLCFVAALLSKTSGILLPVVLVACSWWRRGRVGRKTLLRALPFFIVLVPFVFTTLWFQHHRAMAGHAVQPESTGLRILGVGPAFWFYALRLLVPVDLMMVYPYFRVQVDLVTIVADLALVGTTVLLWRYRGGWARAAWFAFLCAAALLAPVLGIFDMNFLRFARVSDHFVNMAAVPLVAFYVSALAAGLTRGALARTARVYLGGALLAVALVALGSASWVRQQTFSTEEVFWREVVARNPEAWLGWLNLGYSLAERGHPREAIAYYQRAAESGARDRALQFNWGRALHLVGDSRSAIEHYQAALAIEPDYAEAHLNLGTELEAQNQDDEAKAHYLRAIQISPTYAAAYNNLGNILVRQGDVEDARRCYVSALKIRRDYPEAMNNLGKLLADENKPDEAVIVYRRAIQLKPDFAAAWNNLGEALATMGRLDDAEAACKKALQAQPRYAAAQTNLGLIEQRRGHPDRAMECYRVAMEMDPLCVLALNNQAWLMATCADERLRNGWEAIGLARRAVDLTRQRDPLILDTLAAALAEVGRFPEAVDVAGQALAAAEHGKSPGLTLAIKRRLALYRKERAFRE